MLPPDHPITALRHEMFTDALIVKLCRRLFIVSGIYCLVAAVFVEGVGVIFVEGFGEDLALLM